MKKELQKFKTEKNKYFFDALLNSWSSLLIHPSLPLWLSFALSANERGREITRIIEKYTLIKGATYLDLGFSYGGLIVAFSEKGAISYGFEINKEIIHLAKANFKDNNIKPEIYIKNIEDEIEDRFKGFFNIITCNNVLEHVKNPERTIRNISSLLSPEGIAYFEIPNKYFPGFILKDEHTSLFAITLLEQSDALTYYNRFHPDGIYTVGHYLTLDEYINSFKKAAMDPSVVDEIFSDYRKDKILKDIGELKNNKYTLLSSVPEDIRGLLQQKLNLYLKGFFKTLKYDEKNFPLSYGVPYWKIVCKKTSL